MTSVTAELMDAADQGDRSLQLGRGEARQRFVEQHETRAGREHSGDLEALASGCAQRSGTLRSLRRKTRQLDDMQGVLARVAPMVVPQKRADHHIVEHRHIFEGDRHLESASDSRLVRAPPPRRG